MREESKPVFVTDDGKVFATKEEALSHEADSRKRQEALKKLYVRRVSHGFDATEGRGYFAKTLIVTDASSAVLTQWCIDKFGQPLDAWYGNGFYERWILSEKSESDTVEWAMAHEGHKAWHSESPWKLVVISKNDFTWAGLPESQFPWPRPSPASGAGHSSRRYP